MRWLLFLLINAITLLFQLAQKGGVKAIISENLILKHQLLIIGRSRQRAPTLNPLDRFILGWLTMLLNPGRMMKAAIIIKPSTLLAFHRALVRRKYQRLFGSVRKGKPGPKGPRKELISIILELNNVILSMAAPRSRYYCRNDSVLTLIRMWYGEYSHCTTNLFPITITVHPGCH